ncbi:hypothetical protein [Bosea sp. BK604]|uniref:hypothetical protein n=1 Tax=Bosea sp. BK604 TaxID=2512180 RepID=UPI0010493270|nr:hypothetical protein [Bosea sp. BK604]TCR69717.1 hypothetical protein EV560_101114 [Bosea sp. BK604]
MTTLRQGLSLAGEAFTVLAGLCLAAVILLAGLTFLALLVGVADHHLQPTVLAGFLIVLVGLGYWLVGRRVRA